MTARPTLLLVEPYPSARSALADLLRESGYSVFAVPDGVEGVRAARGRRLSLAIVDLSPAASTTLPILERLRGGMPGRDTPVLVLTSSVSAEPRERALAAGCAGLLQKPCSLESVLAEVARILGPASRVRRVAPPSGASFRNGDGHASGRAGGG
jgi:CheY-like chemotaxis protein